MNSYWNPKIFKRYVPEAKSDENLIYVNHMLKSY